MSQPKRIGVKPLQVKIGERHHEMIQKRLRPGIRRFQVVEHLLALGAEAEDLAVGLAGAVSASTQREPRTFTDEDSLKRFLEAHAAYRCFFLGRTKPFVEVLRRLSGPGIELKASEWHEWTRKMRVPAKFIPAVETLILVIDGVDRAQREAGAYDNPTSPGKKNR